MGKTITSKSSSKKATSASTPHALKKKKSLTIKKKTASASKPSSPKKSPSKAKSAFTKEVHLFRDQKDWFSVDRKYDNW